MQANHIWYLVHTKSRQETVALENLERQGYQCYLPQLQVERIRHRKAVLVTEPMFARYLFVQMDTQGTGKSWAPIQSTTGVSNLVKFGSRAATVDARIVDFLRAREHVEPVRTMFQPGESVTMVDGPFRGIEAVFHTADAQQRAVILLEILCKPVTMRVELAQLRKLHTTEQVPQPH
jgi:transcriptional antiterminator RfaH